MRQALEGSQAVARAVASCRPGVVAAYPITPQTHIVENISKLVADGLCDCEMVSVESEFSAASVVLGAAATGSRAYTATSSQGILLMAEVLYNIAGMRIPLVLTCANRAVSAPISIWNDQQDSMAVRDAGWIQLYCADNQEATDATVQAFRIAERMELPVMVCMDGFVLTHTMEPIDLPDQDQVDGFLPPYHFSRTLDSGHPMTLGGLAGPDYYAEIRHAHHRALLASETEIVSADRDWAELTGRASGGLLAVEGDADAELAVLAIGSVVGTLREAMQEYEGAKAKLIKLRCFRPFPVEALQQACRGVRRLIVLERALSPGGGGILGTEVRAALSELSDPPVVYNYAVGLGGRDVPMDLYPRLLEAVESGQGERFSIFDVELEKLPEEDR
ncbi:MAG TPA: transketolase C-terminal domain-containing protein [Mariprofundaceae bacterium]|nr:transketolase C-terminal domain-containing protein [Mariprofundaceae bacterium]